MTPRYIFGMGVTLLWAGGAVILRAFGVVDFLPETTLRNPLIECGAGVVIMLGGAACLWTQTRD